MGCAPITPHPPLRAPGVFGAVARALRGAPRARHARVSRGGCLALPGRSTPCLPAEVVNQLLQTTYLRIFHRRRARPHFGSVKPARDIPARVHRPAVAPAQPPG
jgi:hypothetical protein